MCWPTLNNEGKKIDKDINIWKDSTLRNKWRIQSYFIETRWVLWINMNPYRQILQVEHVVNMYGLVVV